jgi:hypothetical protein
VGIALQQNSLVMVGTVKTKVMVLETLGINFK